jgi:hypothetical protein
MTISPIVLPASRISFMMELSLLADKLGAKIKYVRNSYKPNGECAASNDYTGIGLRKEFGY